MHSCFSKILALSLGIFIMGGCGVAERSVKLPTSSPKTSDKPVSEERTAAVSLSKYKEVKGSLDQAYRKWKGTPYVMGGTSSSGIDCSAFMQILFDDYFSVDLPRNTRRQLYTGWGVRRAALITGDLVFFKTGRKTLHVGVIMDDEEFLHASTSQGVIISSLDDYYWKSRYLAGRRVMEVR